MDHKLFGQTGEKAEMEVPEADVGLISGGIRNEENRTLAKEMRKKCKILIALGSCACSGGVPALANLSTTQEVLEKVYRGSKTTDTNGIPNQQIPPLTDRVYAVHEVVPVDMKLPGCPTTPEMVAGALTALLEGKPYPLSSKSVCDECPTIREKKSTGTLKRRLDGAGIYAGRAPDGDALLDGAGHPLRRTVHPRGLRGQRGHATLHSRLYALRGLLWPPHRYGQPDGGHDGSAVQHRPRPQADPRSLRNIQSLCWRRPPTARAPEVSYGKNNRHSARHAH